MLENDYNVSIAPRQGDGQESDRSSAATAAEAAPSTPAQGDDPPTAKRIEATYDSRCPDGSPIYQVVRPLDRCDFEREAILSAIADATWFCAHRNRAYDELRWPTIGQLSTGTHL
jgi:hypothetical protein